MELTSENYKDIIKKIQEKISDLKNSNNPDVSRGVEKILETLTTEEKAISTLIKDNDILKIGIVGQVKAGKSSFMNSLFFEGENILPHASTPMTAGLTVLQYGEENMFEVEYYNTTEWEIFEKKAKQYDEQIEQIRKKIPEYANLSDADIAKEGGIGDEDSSAKELISTCTSDARSKIQTESLKETVKFNDIKELQGLLATYVGAEGKFTPITKCLTLSLNNERLEGMQIVDTPGVNDPVVSREARTKEFLKSCHGVFLLSFASRYFDKTDVDFLCNRIGSDGIGRVVLIASKFDSVLQDVGNQCKDDLDRAINSCKQSLKKQFQNNIANTSYKGKRPVLDYSSGIGYSIANKSRLNWDSTEKNVVEQMSFYYPSYFENDEMIKEEFLALSQIEKMQTKYVDEDFKSKKDEIIAEKTKSYIEGISPKIVGKIKEVIDNLKLNKQRLEENDLSNMKEKDKVLGNIVNEFEKQYQTIAKGFSDRIQAGYKKFNNALSLSFNEEIPIVKGETNVRYTKVEESGGFFSTKRTIKESGYTVEYDDVDGSSLVNKTIKIIDSFFETKTNEWNKTCEGFSQYFVDKFSDIVEDYSDVLTSADKKQMRIELSATNEAINNIGVLDIRNFKNQIISKLENAISQATSDDIGYKQISINDSAYINEEKNKIKSLANKKIENIKSLMRSIYSSPLEEFSDIVSKSAEDITQKVASQQHKFIDVLKKKVEEDQEKLKKQLKDKEVPMQQYEDAIKLLESVLV